jgi:8-amino-7-oxononanoate synthase
VRRFREYLRRLGLSASGGVFPVQTLHPIPGLEIGQLHSRLLTRGVKTVLGRARDGWDARLSFLITMLHTPADIDEGITALQAAWALAPRKRQSSLIDI